MNGAKIVHSNKHNNNTLGYVWRFEHTEDSLPNFRQSIAVPSVIFWNCNVKWNDNQVYNGIIIRRFIISAKWTKWMAEIMCSFDVCLSVCVCVCVCAAAGQWELMLIAQKRLKLRTSNLAQVFPGTVRTRHPKIFPKGGVARVTWPSKFFGDKC